MGVSNKRIYFNCAGVIFKCYEMMQYVYFDTQHVMQAIQTRSINTLYGKVNEKHKMKLTM